MSNPEIDNNGSGDELSRSALENLSSDIISFLRVFEEIQRFYYPGMPHLHDRIRPFLGIVKSSRAELKNKPAVADLEETRRRLTDAVDLCMNALELLVEEEGVEQSLISYRKAGRKINQLQETLYPLHEQMPVINRFFLEQACHHIADRYLHPAGPEASTGLIHVGVADHPHARGSYSIYVPEAYDGLKALPVVVALHGGFSHGRDFIWSWLREARSRGFLLVAPSSRGTTWSITGSDIDANLLNEMLGYLQARWNIDDGRVLLTGMSDGATYALKQALDAKSPFAAYAVFSGVLPPFDLRHVKGRRIIWIHGAKDWMFPFLYARNGYQRLMDAGADITLQIVPDLYHAYPRDWNDRVLGWFDPALSLPAGI